MASAEDVGKRLLGEVEECGLDEILRALRPQDGRESEKNFNFPHIDQLLHIIEEQRPPSNKTNASQPIIELMSLAIGSGKTHLLYHLCALAVLPRNIGGKQACAIIIETDGKFSVSRLGKQIRLILSRLNPSKSTEEMSEDMLYKEVLSALKHVHIFRPQYLASTIATLDSLPIYLFNQDHHYSFDREVALIALDSASSFYWQDRSELENAAFLAKTTPNTGTSQTSAYFQLATALKTAAKTFNCSVVFTTWYLGPQQRTGDGTAQKAFRPQIPPLQASLRLVLHRLPVRKFSAGLSLDGALREAEARQKAVADGRIECFVNEWGLDERLLRRLSGAFEFRVLDDGLLIEETKDQRQSED